MGLVEAKRLGTYTIEWRVLGDGDLRGVVEQYPDGSWRQWHDVPGHLVAALIEERREAVNKAVGVVTDRLKALAAEAHLTKGTP